MQDLAALAQDYVWGVNAQRQFFFLPKDQSTYFWRWQGRHFQDIELKEDISKLYNRFYVKGGEIDKFNKTNFRLEVADDAPGGSIETYGLREKIITAPSILNDTDLQRWADWILSEAKDPKTKGKLVNVIMLEPEDLVLAKGRIRISTEGHPVWPAQTDLGGGGSWRYFGFFQPDWETQETYGFYDLAGVPWVPGETSVSELTMDVKAVKYTIDSKGMRANITLGERDLPVEDVLLEILRDIEAERILGDARVTDLA